jgi:hypothetical protein
MMPGVEILANATWTALHGLPLHSSLGVDVFVIVLLGLVPLSALFLRGWLVLLASLLAAGIFLIGVQVAFNQGLIVSVVYPLLTLGLSCLGVLVAQVVLRGSAPLRVAAER